MDWLLWDSKPFCKDAYSETVPRGSLWAPMFARSLRLTPWISGAIKRSANPRVGGAVAQLGARLDGIEEVVGSNPIGSTRDVL